MDSMDAQKMEDCPVESGAGSSQQRGDVPETVQPISNRKRKQDHSQLKDEFQLDWLDAVSIPPVEVKIEEESEENNVESNTEEPKNNKLSSSSSVPQKGYEIIKITAIPKLPEEPLSKYKKVEVYTKRHLLEHAFNMGSTPCLSGLQDFTKTCHHWINEKFSGAEEELRKKFVKTFVNSVSEKYRSKGKGKSGGKLILTAKKYRCYLDGIIQLDKQDYKRVQLLMQPDASSNDPHDPLFQDKSMTERTVIQRTNNLWCNEYACSQCSFKTKDQEELNFHYSIHDKKQKDSLSVSGNGEDDNGALESLGQLNQDEWEALIKKQKDSPYWSNRSIWDMVLVRANYIGTSQGSVHKKTSPPLEINYLQSEAVHQFPKYTKHS